MRTFVKCDFHLHSSSDFSRNYSESEFLNTLVSSGLDYVAITDHNGIDLNLYEKARKRLSSANIGLLAGVELNLKLSQDTIKNYGLHVASKSGKNYFHAIVLSSIENVSLLAEKIDGLFIQSGILSRDDVAKVKNGTMHRKDLSQMTDGKAIDLSALQDVLQSLPHFFIPHECKGSRNLSDYLPIRCSTEEQSKANKRYRDSLFYYNHGQAVEGGEKSERRISNRLCREYNDTVAALLFSDAKELSEIGKKFTWIDFDGDLSSLQLAISDPESRIRTSDKCPNNPQGNIGNYLQTISFDMLEPHGGSRRHVEIEFAPGYNGIVGSRGSGKSLLAHLLVNEGLEPYKDIVDKNSVRYKRFGGMEGTVRPSCLYLGQGALEKIFESEDYSEIPMLDQFISSQKKDSQERSREAAGKIDALLSLQKKLLLAFMGRYSNGLVHIDFLDGSEPSGVSLPVPNDISPRDKSKVMKARKALSVFGHEIKESKAKLGEIDLEAVFPENEKLMTELDKEAHGIGADCIALVERIERFCAVADQSSGWFEDREWLLKRFGELLREANRKDSSSLRADYVRKREDAANFYLDLLGLRVGLKEIDEEIDALREKELKPISDAAFEADKNKSVVKFGFSDESTYADHASDLIKGRDRSSRDVLVLSCLEQGEPTRVKKLYNGNKLKVPAGAKASDYIDKYFALLGNKLHSDKRLKTEIELNGTPLSSMSPGMRADTLLQLFLGKSARGEAPCYIVLDQPEDNLDVKTISGFLVDRLKTLKFDVQLFVVSHSAPVVVNGDARLIVSCQEEGGAIAYRPGVLSDDKTKQVVASVLDGGERYLKMRLNKYNFQLGDER